MLKLYFGFKILIPLVLILVIILLIFISLIRGNFYSKKKAKVDKLMKEKGYEYYLRDVASFGDKDWWAYKKDGKSIDCDKLYEMKFREVNKLF